jgi:hypothetical protein
VFVDTCAEQAFFTQSDWYGQATMNGQAVNIAMNARGDVVIQ